MIKNLTIEKREPDSVSNNFFVASVQIIHHEVSAVWKSKVNEIVNAIRRAESDNAVSILYFEKKYETLQYGFFMATVV